METMEMTIAAIMPVVSAGCTWIAIQYVSINVLSLSRS